MQTRPTFLFLIAIMIFISLNARGEQTPLFSVLGTNVMREEMNLNVEPSEAAIKSMDKLFPDGRPANWAECFRIKEVLWNISPAIQSKYIDDNKLRPSEEEITDYMGRLKYVHEFADGQIVTNNLYDDADEQMMRDQALWYLTDWKLNVALYEMYGGRIKNTDSMIWPEDALYSLLKDAERDGLFTIHDNDLRMLFWSCITNQAGTFMSEEDGKNALYRHPADKLIAIADQTMSNIMDKTKGIIESRKENIALEESKKNSEPAPPEGRGEAPRP